MIVDEGDVRNWVRQASAGKARWVEPSMGSTIGLPDCWVPMDNGLLTMQVHLELKAGEIKGNKLCYTVRPEQRRELRAMLRDGVPVGFVIGVTGTVGSFVFAWPTTQAQTGRLAMDSGQGHIIVEHSHVCGFWRGVNFIFSGSR